VATLPEMTRILSRMNVAFHCSDGRASFIASDAPAYMFNSKLQFAASVVGPGLRQKHVGVRMPLSPDTGHGPESNRMTFGHSHEYFIANSSKVKRRWFWRLPLDPVFIWRYLRQRMIAAYRRNRARKQQVALDFS
jgi:hypothetical protein